MLFTSLLLGSTIILQLGESASPLAPPLLLLYGLIAGIFLLSFTYAVILKYVKRGILFTYIQISIDTVVVSLIIFVTGCYSSIFSFLYLVIIIYSSMLLFRRGSMIMAALCSIQYGIMLDLEFYGILKPLNAAGVTLSAADYAGSHVLYKIMITMVACFAVAILSSLLSEEERKTKKELAAMEDHVKRVEKLAVVGEMAAGLAHEIKNPLASLTGSIQLLSEDIDYNPQHERLMQIVLREADRLSSLASNFLLFAKPPAGKTEAIDLGKVLSEVVELLDKTTKKGRDVSVTKTVTPNVWVQMDAGHLRQILWNLLLNAAEAIDGSGRIQIQLYPSKSRFACIEISDDGCGMTRETLESIFDPFFTTKPGGTGLGLSIVHSILESYNGWLEVESKINEGTTFTLKFRLIRPPT
ncbi:MAG: ATP-binding protein [Desulfobacterales bacterium]|nr:ATP-binding protein [Desulfobacterales bacterium]